ISNLSMMNLVSTWFIPAQLLVATTAQDVGRFVHVTGVHKMTFDAGVADDPFAGIQTGDLTTLAYTSGDTFTTDFRDEMIKFMRVAESFTPGVFEYAQSVAPYFKLTYLIRDDGLIGIQASRKRRRTSQLPFRLSRRDKGVQYLHYELESAGTGTLPGYLLHGDLSPVVFATSDTIYVALGGARLALTRT
ncbi:hypothetical protein FOZ63_012303, partial [Perkinsus olseni]